jgi:hypothetical protein
VTHLCELAERGGKDAQSIAESRIDMEERRAR